MRHSAVRNVIATALLALALITALIASTQLGQRWLRSEAEIQLSALLSADVLGLSDVCELLHEVDAVMARFGKPVYFDPPLLHVTFAVVDFDARASRRDAQGDARRHGRGEKAQAAGEEGAGASFDVCVVQAKAGHLRASFPLGD